MEAPSVETMTRLMLKCEQSIHKDGWDQSPLVCAVVWQPGSVLTMFDTEIPAQAKSPEALMTALGHGAKSGPEFGQAVQRELGETFYGWAHVWIGYYPDGPDTPVEQWTHTVSEPPDPAKATMVRLICAVDLLGQPYTVRRIRGRKPEIHNALSDPRAFNRIHAGLGDMIHGVIQHMPWAAEYLFDLEEVHLPRLTDLISASHSAG